MFYLCYGFLYLLSLLPVRLLYFLSDGLAFLLGAVIGYRRRVILDNLAHAFPEKSADERRAIARQFYSNFTDYLVETLKLISASDAFIDRHFRVDNPELYEKLFADGKKCQLHLGHVFNWEFANIALPKKTRFRFLVVYMPVENRVFNRLMMKVRSRTGTELLSARDTRRQMLKHRNEQYMLVLVADQAPGSAENAYWLPFFHREAPFVRSPERGAVAGNIPVLFVHFYKEKRGHYRASLHEGATEPATLPEGELTRRYVRFLEWSVAQDPALYLWSHKRWKYPWKEEYRKSWIGG